VVLSYPSGEKLTNEFQTKYNILTKSITPVEITLDSKNFDTEVLNSPLPVLVDFWASWCAPCQIVAPLVTEIAQSYKGKLKVAKLNVDENPELANRYHISSIPNLKIFKDGKIIHEIVGVVPKQEIIKQLEKHL